ncbi:MAG: hypothetical protein K9G27_06125 [Sphingomonadaceae bacterium]|nr:hypothetical protein [Sphingomonadaceae bacterium]
MEIGAVIFMIVALICYVIIANSQGDGDIKGAASNIENLLNDAQLVGDSLWTITIFRKSGYLHDVREFMGDANTAISKALASCRRSGIYNIILTKNEPAILEFYSANQEGGGKAIGGFRISAVQSVEAPNLSETTQTAVNDLSVQLEEARRTLAQSLLDSIKPNMSAKQAEILGALPEDEIIEFMVAQMEGVEQLSGKPFHFVIPVNYTCKDGVRYDDVPLTISIGDNAPTDALTNSHLTNQTEQPPSSSESFEFPEQDAWDESVYELGSRPFRCDVKLGFSYADSNGTITKRQIHTKAFVQWNHDDHLVLGFCNYRKANRSFLTSRMESVTDLETGKYIYDIDRYLTETYATSDYKKVDEFIHSHMSVVECLLYLAKLDGTITKMQKSLIIGYISGKCGVAMVTDLVANKLIKEFAEDLTPQNFRKLISQMRKEQPENLSELRYLGPEVVSARRSSNAGGKAALAAILDEGA